MIRPTVEVVLSYVDKVTAPLRGTSTGMRSVFADMAKSIVPVVDVGDLLRRGFEKLKEVLGNSFTAFDENRIAAQKLEGTARITGTSLENLTEIARRGREEFKLSRADAADFAVEVGKLATKAGDVGMAAPLLQKFLDIGAARGLTAKETLTAVKQAILGIDEGTDKLLNANPSVLYKQFADAIGVSAGKLTDQQKAMALATAAMTDGGRVIGAYSGFLETTAGHQELVNVKTQDFYLTIGSMLNPLRELWLSIKEGFLNLGILTLKGWEMISTSVVAIAQGAIAWYDKLIGQALIKTADWMGKAAAIVPFVGDKMTEAADKIGDFGVDLATKGTRGLAEISNTWQDRMLEIQGIQTESEEILTATTTKGNTQRTSIVSEELKKQRDAAEKAFDGIAAAFTEAYRTDENSSIRDAQNAIRDINEALASQKGLTAEQRAELNRMADAYALNVFLLKSAVGIEEELKQVRDLTGTTERMERLNGLYEQAVELRGREGANSATVAYYTKLIADLQKEANGTLQGNAGFQRAIADATRAAQLAYAMMSGDVRALAGLLGEGEQSSIAIDTSWHQIGDSVVNAARGVISLGKEMGVLDDRSASVLGNLINLTDVMQKGLGSLKAGDIIGAIGALAGVIGGMFGESPEARAQKALLQKNVDAMNRLANVNGLLLSAQTPGAKIAEFQDLLGSLGGLGAGPDNQLGQESRFKIFRGLLQSKGLTITDAEQMAKDLGIDLGITDGKISSGAMRQFVEAISTANFSAFENSFSGFLDRIDFEGRLAGGLTATQELGRIGDALSQGYGSSLLAQQFAGIDLSTPEGKQALLDRILGIGQNVESLTPGQRGGLTGQEFTDIIVRITDLLRSSLEDAAGTGAAPSTPTVPASAPEATFTPSTPDVSAPATPAVYESGAFGLADLGSLLGDKLDLLVDQGRRMIDLQGRIADASETTATATAIMARQRGDSSGGDALDLLLQAELERANQTLGGTT